MKKIRNFTLNKVVHDDKILDAALEHFIRWYTLNKCKLSELDIKELRALFVAADGFKEEWCDIAEFIAVAHLETEGFSILYSAYRNTTVGKAHPRGIDGIFEKDNSGYFVEVKGEEVYKRKNYISLLGKLEDQINERLANKADHIDIVGDKIKTKAHLTNEDFEMWRTNFLNTVTGLGYIVSNEIDEKLIGRETICPINAYVISDRKLVDDKTKEIRTTLKNERKKYG